jgi:hypothetical protein
VIDEDTPYAAEKPAKPEPEREPLYAFWTDYLKQDGPKPGMLVHRAFHVMRAPRPILACRLLGHKPVVDGTRGTPNRPGYRWVCCDRCGLRTSPQGDLTAATRLAVTAGCGARSALGWNSAPRHGRK